MRSLKPLLVVGVLSALVVVSCLVFFDDGAADVAQRPPAEGPRPAANSPTAPLGDADPGLPRAASTPARLDPEAGGAAASSRPLERSFHGRVIDARNVPVANATVYLASAERSGGVPLENLDPAQLAWARRASATTDTSGGFQIALVAAGNLRLGVRAPGFAPLDRTISNVDAVHELGDVVLEDSVVLSGRVLDSARRPVAGALVRRLDAEAGSALILSESVGDVVATTDEAGAFRVDELASGPWLLVIRAEGHPDKIERGTTSRAGQVVDGLEIVLIDGAEIRGRIVGAPPEALPELWVRAVPVRATGKDPNYSGALANEAELLVVPRSARCAADATFVVRGLTRDANYRVSGRDDEHDLLESARTTWVEALAGASGIVLTYKPPTSIVFELVDDATSEPVLEHGLSVLGRAVVKEVLDGGRVQLVLGADHDAPESPPFEVVIEATEYEVLRLGQIPLIEGQALDLGVVRLKRAPMVSVRVLDDVKGEPVSGASVELIESKASDLGDGSGSDASKDQLKVLPITDGEGRARLPGRLGRTSRLCVRHPDFALAQTDTFVLASTGDREETVRLRAGGTVIVQARTANGDAVASVPIRHFVSPRPLETDERGQCIFKHLWAGQHRFQAESDTMPWGDIIVTDGTEQVLTLTVPARARLTGRVTEGGQPLSGATLYLRLKAIGPQTARTNGQGQYAFASLERGTYRASIVHPSRAMAFDCEVSVVDALSSFDVDLPITAIAGRLVDEDDRPLAGLRVSAVTVETGWGAVSGVGGEARVLSGPDGRFVLRGVQSEAEVVVRASSENRQPAQSEALWLTPGQLKSGVELKLLAGALLEVTVTQADGRPASGCWVRALWEETESSEADLTDTRGKASFPGLRPGKWRIQLETRADGNALNGRPVRNVQEQVVDVALGRTNTARFELR